MNGNVKEFHLVAEPWCIGNGTRLPKHLWGYNGPKSRPNYPIVEDQVRIFVTNKLPEHTSALARQRLPNGMDGVTGLTQPGIAPGKPCL